jgi:hypothetical protein
MISIKSVFLPEDDWRSNALKDLSVDKPSAQVGAAQFTDGI